MISLTEDALRRRRRLALSSYDPLTACRCEGRVLVNTPEPDVPSAWVPVTMTADPEYRDACTDRLKWARLRARHDFEYWAFRCVVIKHKTEGTYVPFVLNRPQRKVLAVLESDRLAGRPIRLILLKARQWGGSTLVQIFMAWIQSCHRTNWHSLICAHVKDTAASIRGMYTTLLNNYPREMWEGDCPPEFKSYERALNVRQISGRGCRVTLGSAENADAIRGADYAMAHLSETAFWGNGKIRNPENFVQAVCGAIALIPYSLIVMESTANGVGNYFHREWLRCRDGRGDKHAVFIPWYDIDIYSCPPPDRERFAREMDEVSMRLWDMGLDLDQIYWYWCKRREYASPERLKAEYPTDDVEAFSNSGSGVFFQPWVEALRAGCVITPQTGVISGASFVSDPTGWLRIWSAPRPEAAYIVTVDVGGRTEKADWSVVAVLRLPLPDAEDDKMEIVAQCRCHCDHDILVDRAMAVAYYYNEALLVVESNSLESAGYGGSDSNLFILSRLAESYPNVYRRQCYDTVQQRHTTRVGFHTNRATKSLLVAELVEAVRDGAYIERDPDACDELAVYEQLPNGSYAAKPGYHDDILITRAMAIHVAHSRQIHLSAPISLRPRW